MKLSNKLLTYPLLSELSGDFKKEISINSEISAWIENQEIIFNINFLVGDDNLLQLIDSGKAVGACIIECERTRYREGFFLQNESTGVQIPVDIVDVEIQISTFILANEKIENYKSDNFSNIFQGLSFLIEEGCYLAICQDITWPINRTDSINNVPSFFEVIPHNKAKKSIEVSTDSDTKISIYLEKTTYQQYLKLNNDPAYRPALISMIGVPAITEILTNLSEYEDKRWFQAFIKRLEQINISLDNITNEIDTNFFEIADAMVGYSVSESIKNLSNLEDLNDFEEE
jgi:hypothetical protein